MKSLWINDYGIEPDTSKDALPAFKRALEAAVKLKVRQINFQPGKYNIYPEQAWKIPYYISNTASESENPDPVKTIGLLLKGFNDLTIEGNGSLLLFHGRMTPLVIDGASNITIRNLKFDHVRPTISEMTVAAVGPNYLDCLVHKDSRYQIEDGVLTWTGDGWSHVDGPAQEYEAETNRTWRINNPVSTAVKAVELQAGLVRLFYQQVPETAVGHTFQMRDGIRDQVGIFIQKSSNVVLDSLSIYYSHGLGIVGQYSTNLLFKKLDFSPRPHSERTAAASADCIQLSGCRGKVEICDSKFEGTHDDPINVHGTHLLIVDQPDQNRLTVRFMHHQTYGFEAFFPGDTIELVNATTLIAFATAKVKEVTKLSPREISLTLDRNISGLAPRTVVENVTWTPDLTVRNNLFARVPTRGLLVTTRGKVLIEHNTFSKTEMSAILIANDGESWYESGPVRNMVIRQNLFERCGEPVINIAPENKQMDREQQVHQNILIEENNFLGVKSLVLAAKSCGNLVLQKNSFIDSSQQLTVELKACSDVEIKANQAAYLKVKEQVGEAVGDA